MLINSKNLDIASLVSKEENRYAISGILITPRETVATDGHQLTRVTIPTIDPESFPTVPGMSPACKFDGEFILGGAQALQISKALPKATKRRSIPILQNALIGARDEERGALEIGVTDLDSPQVFRPLAVAGQFPNPDLVMKRRADAKVEISFDLKLLLPVLKQAEKFMAGERSCAVVIDVYDEESPIRINAHNYDTGQTFCAMVMPLRVDRDERYNYLDVDKPQEIEETQEPEVIETGRDVAGLSAESSELREVSPQPPAPVITIEDEEPEPEDPPARLHCYGCGRDYTFAQAYRAPDSCPDCRTYFADAFEERATDRAADALVLLDSLWVSSFGAGRVWAIVEDFRELFDWMTTGALTDYPPDGVEAMLDDLEDRIRDERRAIELVPMCAALAVNLDSQAVAC